MPLSHSFTRLHYGCSGDFDTTVLYVLLSVIQDLFPELLAIVKRYVMILFMLFVLLLLDTVHI